MGDYTVVFTLDAPTASFPYLTSNTTYQAIILPARRQGRPVHERHGRHRAVQHHLLHAGRRREVRTTPSWWGGKSLLDGVDVTYYADESAAIVVVLSGADRPDADLGPRARCSGIRSSPPLGPRARRIVRSRCSSRPSPRSGVQEPAVRQALALCLDRPALTKLMLGASRSGTTSRSGRVRLHLPVDQAADAEPPAGEEPARSGGGSDPKFTVDVEAPQAPGARSIDPGVRPRGRGHINLDVMTEASTTTPSTAGGGLRDDDPVAELDRSTHGLRRPRCPERRPQRGAHVQRSLERGRLHEPGLRLGRENVLGLH